MKKYKSELPSNYLDTGLWVQPNIEFLSDSQKRLYTNRKIAVDLYIGDKAGSFIEQTTGISASYVVKLFKKCVLFHPDGKIYGYRALIPYRHIKKFVRYKDRNIKPSISKGGFAGAFQSLLMDYPVLKCLLEDEITKKNIRKIYESGVSTKYIHRKFIKKCIQLGLDEQHFYPFNTISLAYNSVRAYINNFVRSHPIETLKESLNEDAIKKIKSTGLTERKQLAPFDRVECDAHKIDALFCIMVPSLRGHFTPVLIDRLWLLVIIDIETRCILGYHISIHKECTAGDVLRCVKNSLSKWTKLEHIPSLVETYKESANFPSSMSSKYLGAKWKAFHVDNALANTCNNVCFKMEELCNCRPYVAKRTSADDRPYVEAYFKRFEESIFHRLPSTTGSYIDDLRRKQPELKACNYFIELEDLNQLADIGIANYNAEPHESLAFRSPLQYLDYLTERDNLEYEKVQQDQVEHLQLISKKVTVRGSRQKGKRPYIQLLSVRYTSVVLSNSFFLVGKTITIQYDPDDLRIIRAFHFSGDEIGNLKASPPWNVTKHSILVRKAILRLKADKRLRIDSSEDPVEKYLSFCEEKLKGKKPSTAYLDARRAFTETYLKDSSTVTSSSSKNCQRLNLRKMVDKRNTCKMVPQPRFARSSND